MTRTWQSNSGRGRWASAVTAAVMAAIAIAMPLSSAAQPRYQATPIGKGTTAKAINAYGDVVGSITTPSGERAFLWSDGTLQLLGTLGGTNSWAVAVNDRREVAGHAETASGDTHAFLWRNGAMQDLGVLAGHRESVAAGVNNFGWVVGTSSVEGASPQQRAFLHDGQSMTDLGTLGGPDSSAYAINDAGLVVGEADRLATRRGAFLYSAGTMLDLGDRGTFSTNSAATAISRLGRVAGFQNSVSVGLPGFFTNVWLYLNGQRTDLFWCGSLCGPTGINDRDQVVGRYLDRSGGGAVGAYVWDGVIGLSTLSAPGWTIESASGINDGGQVVAQGCNSEGCQGLRLEPLGTVRAIEYVQDGYDNYFLTVRTSEISLLDSNALPDWRRTGKSFDAWYSAATNLVPMCRFWSNQSFAPKSSHFYTAYADECAMVKRDNLWLFEGTAFYARMPEGSLGARTCPAGTQPLYRAYNNGVGGAPNHRYTTDPAVLDAMLAQGWIMEGEVATRVFACVPAQE